MLKEQLLAGRSQYRRIFCFWIVLFIIACVNVGVIVYNLDSLNINVDLDVNANGLPVAYGGAKAEQMFYDMEELANDIHNHNVMKDQFWRRVHESTDNGLVDSLKDKMHDAEYYLTQKMYLFQQKMKLWRQSMYTRYESNHSQFTLLCRRIWVWLCSVFQVIIQEESNLIKKLYMDMQHENVALRIQLLQLFQKNKFLAQSLKSTDKEGYLVLTQLENTVESLKLENQNLDNRIQGLLGTCVCGNVYNVRAASYLDYELTKCTTALDQCLTGSSVDIDNSYFDDINNNDIEDGYFNSLQGLSVKEVKEVKEVKNQNAKQIYLQEKEEEEEEEQDDDDERVEQDEKAMDEENGVVSNDACLFYMEVADKCIAEKGKFLCKHTFDDVFENCN